MTYVVNRHLGDLEKIFQHADELQKVNRHLGDLEMYTTFITLFLIVNRHLGDLENSLSDISRRAAC